ncbi:MAG: tRNA pseudouridine(38-40) synthase TruA [Anaerolineae bacterium]|nr:tRNA pseudouridine(38-40) synthase TruA [Anaerolineae bacterium]
MVQNYRATVEYDGTEYSGFQVQVGRRTIQGELEAALQRITQQSIRVNGAGRTDAGVHARGQVINFRVEWRHSNADLERALNALLPRDIAVRELQKEAPEFHARFSARRRMYVYSIYNSAVRAPLLERFAYWVPGELDLLAMQEAAEFLVGEQDFAAFGQPPFGEQTVRTVHRAEWQRHPSPWGKGQPELLQFIIEANAFLRGMVRRIVGTLLLVGQGRLSVSNFAQVLASKDISRAGPPAPARGLCLWQVVYD